MQKHELIRKRRDTVQDLEFLKRVYCHKLKKRQKPYPTLERGIELTRTNLYRLNKELGLSIFNEQTFLEDGHNGIRHN